MQTQPGQPAELPVPVIVNIVERVNLRQRLQCACVSTAWDAAVALCQSLTWEGEIGPAAFQKYLQRYGKDLQTLMIRGAPLVAVQSVLASAREFSRSRRLSGEADARPLVTTPFPGIAAATNMTSLIISNTSLGGEGRALLAALTALPKLQLLRMDNLTDVWRVSLEHCTWLTDIEKHSMESELKIWDKYKAKQLHKEVTGLPDADREPTYSPGGLKIWPDFERNPLKYIMQRLTNLTSLHLKGSKLRACLYNLGELTKLQQLSLDDMGIDVKEHGAVLQGLQGLTSLRLPVPLQNPWQSRLRGLSSLTALQQLQLVAPAGLDERRSEQGMRGLLGEASNLEHFTSLSFVNSGHGRLQLAFSGLTALQQLLVEGRGAGDEAGDATGSHPGEATHNTQLWRVQLPQASLQACCDSWSPQLQHLHFQDCDLQYDRSPLANWSAALPTVGRRLPELTSLQLHNVKPELNTTDLAALASICPALNSLHTCTATEPGQLTALLRLSQLTSLGVKDPSKRALAVIGQLTGLCELRVYGYCRASLGGLRELTALQQLTSLGFTADMRAATMSEVLASALSGRLDGCRFALVNQVVAGCPPNVWSQLFEACYKAETADDAPPSEDDESAGLAGDDTSSEGSSDLSCSYDSAALEDALIDFD